VSYNFGKDISRKLYPEENGKPINLPVQTPTIYLFDSQPTLADAQAGTGSVQTCSSWTQATVEPWALTYSFTAINDPDPTSATPSLTYWEALLYTLKTSGQAQTLLRTIEIERVAGAPEQPETTTEDLVNIYPAITAYATEQQLKEHLAIAIQEIKTELESKGIEWAHVANLSKLKLALAYKTISMVALSQIRERQDKHEYRYVEFDNKYQAQMQTIKLKIDEDQDGTYEVEKESSKFYFISER
jgi:hypothetical protein